MYKRQALDASLLVLNVYEARVPEVDLALYDLGGAVNHMVLQGEALGLHARQFRSFDHDGVARDFSVRPPFTVVTMTAFGRAASDAASEGRAREDVEALLWRG